MTFDKIIDNGKLWAVRYEEETDNELFKLFAQWSDVEYLHQFFKANWNDLIAYFKVTDIRQAITDTIDDNEQLQCLMLELKDDTNLEGIFHPLENYRTSEMLLGKEKAKPKRKERHSSWLRIYAIRLSEGVYVITGGAIKLTFTMEERTHTKLELHKLERVRRFLLEEKIIDNDSFDDYVNTL
ncbi:MAG: hypothetical protein HXO48_02490 [Prevotella sp.]|jgi:hypothetical protein|uniref:hypothetical protein n=1 Tax=Prevotella sp. oral taxon 306 TaxID=712461 RepID=UPI00025BB7B8|nr:hypothetical protein [Prevotella sp. oral taxon 306]EID32752.1 hypothetical protein HMPREF9969_0214 [Prevotella sp. oral taxon 306 str. F0472]MBF1629774.1 hypothetical protein [Prevotella sp.]MBF1631597.1 hypothetical protein [Prevotella sp.]